MVLPLIFLGALLFGILLWVLGYFLNGNAMPSGGSLPANWGLSSLRVNSSTPAKCKRVKGCTVTLDIYSMPSGDSSTTYTRLKAPLQDMQGLQFTLSRKSLVTKVDKALGAKEIATGDAEFDRAFVIRGNNEAKVRALFSNQKIRQLLQTELSATGFLRGNVLDLEVEGDLKDIERLKSLFEVFGEMINQLVG